MRRVLSKYRVEEHVRVDADLRGLMLDDDEVQRRVQAILKARVQANAGGPTDLEDEHPVVSRAEACKELGNISRQTIARMERAGVICPITFSHKRNARKFYRWSDLQALKNGRKAVCTSTTAQG